MTGGSAKASREIANSVSSAQELTRQLASAASLSNAHSTPNVDLHLPSLTGTIQATLPKSLPDAYLAHTPKQAAALRDTSNSDELIASPEALGLVVRRARERLGLSQQRFADLAGVGRRFVSELENGKPTLEFGKVLNVAHAAGLSIFARTR